MTEQELKTELLETLQHMRNFTSLEEYDGAQDYLPDLTYCLAQLVEIQNQENYLDIEREQQ